MTSFPLYADMLKDRETEMEEGDGTRHMLELKLPTYVVGQDCRVQYWAAASPFSTRPGLCWALIGPDAPRDAA